MDIISEKGASICKKSLLLHPRQQKMSILWKQKVKPVKLSLSNPLKIYRIFFFSVKNRNLFHRVDIIGNIFTHGTATSENITDGVHEMK